MLVVSFTHLSLQCYTATTYPEALEILVDGLPRCLQTLRLDMAFTGLRSLDPLAALVPSLSHLSLRLTGSTLQSAAGLEVLAERPLRRLELLHLPLSLWKS